MGPQTQTGAPRWKEPLDPGPKQVRHTAHCKGPPGTRRSHHTTVLKGSPGRQGTLQGATWAKIVSPHGCMSKAAKVHYEGPLVPLDGPLGPRWARHHVVVTQGAPLRHLGARWAHHTAAFKGSPGNTIKEPPGRASGSPTPQRRSRFQDLSRWRCEPAGQTRKGWLGRPPSTESPVPPWGQVGAHKGATRQHGAL